MLRDEDFEAGSGLAAAGLTSRTTYAALGSQSSSHPMRWRMAAAAPTPSVAMPARTRRSRRPSAVSMLTRAGAMPGRDEFAM